MPIIMSKKGSVALTLLAIVGFVFVGLGLIFVSKNYANLAQASRKNEQGLQASLFDMMLVSQRFELNKHTVPIWYPEPYPTRVQLRDLSLLPKIKVIRSEENRELALVSLVGVDPSQSYELDVTRMGAVEKMGERQDRFQTARVVSGAMAKMNHEVSGTFFSNPLSPWPTKDNFSIDKDTLQSSQITFLKYEREAFDPEIISSINVLVENAGKRTVLNVKLPAPPVPECKIELASSQVALLPGADVRFRLMVNSIASYAIVSGNAFLDSETLDPTTAQSIFNLGKYALMTEFSLTAPAEGDWKVAAMVFGVGGGNASQTCNINVKVNIAPKPECTLTAKPQKPAVGQLTRLRLNCINEVTSATINNQAVVYDSVKKEAFLDLRKDVNPTQTILAEAIGPGGESRTQTVLGTGCRFADSNYTEFIPMFGRTFSNSSHREEIYWGHFDYGPTDVLIDFSKPWVYYSNSSLAPGYTGWSWAREKCEKNSICLFSQYQNWPWWGNELYGTYYAQFGPADDVNCKLTKVYSRGVGCFQKDTKVLLENGSQRSIDQIREGDRVWNPKLKKSVVVKKVTAGPEKLPLWKIVIGKKQVRVTEDHPFYTQQGWKQAKELTKQDKIDGQNITLVMKELSAQDEWVWNVELEGENEDSHYVEADGIPAGDLFIQKKIKSRIAKNH